MTARPPHVRSEMRRVYRSVRGAKLTKHAAYIAAAKQLIADRCADLDAKRDDGEICARGSTYQCRFHEQHTQRTDMTGMGDYDDEPIGMVHYTRVLARLVRFLKFVDARTANDNAAREADHG